jgi:hypothetical protein
MLGQVHADVITGDERPLTALHGRMFKEELVEPGQLTEAASARLRRARSPGLRQEAAYPWLAEAGQLRKEALFSSFPRDRFFGRCTRPSSCLQFLTCETNAVGGSERGASCLSAPGARLHLEQRPTIAALAQAAGHEIAFDLATLRTKHRFAAQPVVPVAGWAEAASELRSAGLLAVTTGRQLCSFAARAVRQLVIAAAPGHPEPGNRSSAALARSVHARSRTETVGASAYRRRHSPAW